jgi:Ca-activated chloride channel family protein
MKEFNTSSYTMETTTRNIKKFENYKELFSWFVAAALLLLGVEVVVARRRLP